jgi:hypothetical protein
VAAVVVREFVLSGFRVKLVIGFLRMIVRCDPNERRATDGWGQQSEQVASGDFITLGRCL